MLERGHSGDGCVLALTLYKYTLRKGDLFVLKGATSETGSILLLPLVARCLETLDVCILRMFAFMPLVVTVCGYVGSFVV